MAAKKSGSQRSGNPAHAAVPRKLPENERRLWFAGQLSGQFAQGGADFHQRVLNMVDRSALGEPRETVGAEAVALLDHMIGQVMLAAAPISAHLPPFTWLSKLRDVPNSFFVFEILDPSTIPERRVITETLSCINTDGLPPDATVLNSYAEPDSRRTREYLLEMISLGRAISHLRALRRCAVKDVPLLVEKGWINVPDQPVNLEHILAFDRRHVESMWISHATALPEDWSPEDVRHTLALLLRPGPPEAIPMFDVYNDTNHAPLTLLGFDWYPRDLPIFLFASKLFGLMVATSNEGDRRRLETQGYMVFDDNDLIRDFDMFRSRYIGEAFDRAFPSFAEDVPKGTDVLNKLAWTGSLQPLQVGPVLRPVTSWQSSADLYGLTYRLHSLRQGGVAGGAARDLAGKSFEALVQPQVDLTSWKPEPQVARRVGHTLKRPNDDDLTDLDAVAQHGDMLLIFDAAFRGRTGLHDGDYAQTRNVADALAKKLVKWKEVAEHLRTVAGPTHDLTIYNIVPVVVTPDLYWTHPEVLNEFALPGLHSISSLAELMQWLRENG